MYRSGTRDHRWGLIGLALLGLVYSTASQAQNPPPDRVAHGEYLAHLGGCESCHTATMAGGVAMKLPVGGYLYTPNITPDHDTGIGTWTDEDFLRAMQQGIGHDGEHLYPAFPYTSYTKMSREDVLDIKTWLFTLKPVHAPNRPGALPFPFNIRAAMGVWNAVFATDQRFQPDQSKSADWNRGAYLVQAVAHCGECHTDRNLAQATSGPEFGGGVSDGWTAYNITSDQISGIGGWSDAELTHYLATGAAPGKAWAGGPMADEVAHSTRYLTADDLRSMVTYLRSVPPVRGRETQPRYAGTDKNLPLEQVAQMPGAHLYDLYCSNCHGANDMPTTDLYPSLAHESSVGATSTHNLILAILQGARGQPEPGPQGRPTRMPAFANKFDDAQIAALANYVTGRWGAAPAQVSPGDVATLRAQ